jgi:iron complex transport system ATP-binding protein
MSLTADRISYAYRRRLAEPVPALDDVSVAVLPGSLTGLLGPNGCGKSTLLRLMTGVERPAHGTVRLDGRDLASYPRRELARRISVVPQDTHPAFDYPVMDMVLMGRHPHLGTFQLEGPEDFAAAERALAATGIRHLADRSFFALSGGEKQRVVIAGALAQDGDVLLLDEPTASLDLGAQWDIAELLRRLHIDRAATMVMATHDLNLAASLCDQLVLMKEGRVLAQGPTPEVLTAANVRALYGVDADVRFHEQAGHLTIVAVGRTTNAGRGAPGRVS